MNPGSDNFNAINGGHHNGPQVQARDVGGDVNIGLQSDQLQEEVLGALRRARREDEARAQAQRDHAARMKAQESLALIGLLLFGFALTWLGAQVDSPLLVQAGGLMVVGTLLLGWLVGGKRER